MPGQRALKPAACAIAFEKNVFANSAATTTSWYKVERQLTETILLFLLIIQGLLLESGALSQLILQRIVGRILVGVCFYDNSWLWRSRSEIFHCSNLCLLLGIGWTRHYFDIHCYCNNIFDGTVAKQ